jgi:peptide/nickel transport system ATP-binding protein
MPLLEVKGLKVYFKVRAGWVKAVDDISLTLEKGETVGLVGESGCGKTTLGYAITQLLPSNAHIHGGYVKFKGRNLTQLTMRKDGTLRDYHPELSKIRWKEISMIFQGAMNAFNPVYTVGDQIIEAIRIHEDVTLEEARERVKALYQLIGVPVDRIDNFPHEYSGGMKQRAMIAMALALNPALIIADEPTTALDVITQRKILNEVVKIQKRFGMAMIIITHDVSVVAKVSKRIAVMYAGKLVELGTAREIFKETAHPYAEALLGGFPSITGPKKRMATIPGNPPSLVNPPSGCRFHPRCRYANERCKAEEPRPVEISPGHWSLCHYGVEFRAKRLEVRR